MAVIQGCQACGSTPTLQWNRWANTLELETLAADDSVVSVTPESTAARIPVMACADHEIPLELATYTHHAECSAPPDCDCAFAGES